MSDFIGLKFEKEEDNKDSKLYTTCCADVSKDYLRKSIGGLILNFQGIESQTSRMVILMNQVCEN